MYLSEMLRQTFDLITYVLLTYSTKCLENMLKYKCKEVKLYCCCFLMMKQYDGYMACRLNCGWSWPSIPSYWITCPSWVLFQSLAIMHEMCCFMRQQQDLLRKSRFPNPFFLLRSYLLLWYTGFSKWWHNLYTVREQSPEVYSSVSFAYCILWYPLPCLNG